MLNRARSNHLKKKALKQKYIANFLIIVDLKMGGDSNKTKHLDVERIDFGVFGNSRPFRIRIINRYNDNFDHYKE